MPALDWTNYLDQGGSSATLANSVASSNRSPTSPYAPQVLSVSDNSWIGEPAQQPFDGTLWVCHHQDSFPAVAWPVCDSHFKALVHLQPGPNKLRLDFVCPKLNNGAPHSSWININYLPYVSAPPLDLVILLGRDSKGEFDAVPERKAREGNGLDTAVKKFKMAAYLWQAFTGEQMNRNGFGRRCFRFDEDWQKGTLSCRDADAGVMRNEARIHVVRSDKTVAQLRDPEVAQQNKSAKKQGDLFTYAGEAVRKYFGDSIGNGRTRYVTVLLLDSHWDTKRQLVLGHAALGGGGDGLQLAVFGSHALQSYPTCLEEVVPAFTDCTRTDTNFVANDLNESGSNWEAANIGIGAHMHETGHLFGCPHQESGVMLRDYVRLNRTFTTREPYSTRTKSPGQRLCLPKDECAWHRLDCLRFRFHPCFCLPTDAPIATDDNVQVWSVDNGDVMVTSSTGLAFVEMQPEGDGECHAWIEYLAEGMGPNGLPKQMVLSENDLRKRIPGKNSKNKLKVEVFSAGGNKHVVDDFHALTSKTAKVRLADGRTGYKSSKLGFSNMDGSQPTEVLWGSFVDQKKLMTAVRIFAGYAFDGIEFFYEDRSSELFGKRGGSPQDFVLDTRRGEQIFGFYLRAGAWIDGLQILTSLGRRSPVYGNATGGSG
ncbi:MAG: hypothetical protein Q9159_004445 [Coniocarpon cinnabarinum]